MYEEWKEKMHEYMDTLLTMCDDFSDDKSTSDAETMELLKLALLAEIASKLRGIEASLDAML